MVIIRILPPFSSHLNNICHVSYKSPNWLLKNIQEQIINELPYISYRVKRSTVRCQMFDDGIGGSKVKENSLGVSSEMASDHLIIREYSVNQFVNWQTQFLTPPSHPT